MLQIHSPAPHSVARLALQHARRLGTLLKQLCAAKTYQPETVHQIRVLTRKCTAAWQVLEQICPNVAPTDDIRKTRRLRRRLGCLRDADIRMELFHRFQNGKKSAHPELHGALIHDWHQVFQTTSDRIVSKSNSFLKAVNRLQKQGIEVSNRVKKLHWKNKHLNWIEQKFEAWLPEDEEFNPSQLHTFRIATKRLRYLLQCMKPVRQKPSDHSLQAILNAFQDDLGSLRDLNNFKTWLEQVRLSISKHTFTSKPMQNSIDASIKWCEKEIHRHTSKLFRIYRQLRATLC